MTFKQIFLSLLAVVPLLAACTEPEAPAVTVNPNKISFDYQGGSFAATVTTNGDWVAECESEGVTVTPPSGSQDAVVRIEVAASTIKETEAAVINFTTSKSVRDTIKTRKAKVVITREAMPFIDLSLSEGYVSPEGGGVRVSVSSNHEWTASVPSPLEGLSVKPGEGTFNDEVTISLPENTTGAPRSCEICFKLNNIPGVESRFTLRQNAR